MSKHAMSKITLTVLTQDLQHLDGYCGRAATADCCRHIFHHNLLQLNKSAPLEVKGIFCIGYGSCTVIHIDIWIVIPKAN